MSRLLHWLLFCSAALLLPAAAAQARPETAHVAGLIWSVSLEPRGATIIIEGEAGFVTLKVSRKTPIVLSPPPPPGDESGEGFDLLDPGRAVEVAYDPAKLQALRVGAYYGPPAVWAHGGLLVTQEPNVIELNAIEGHVRYKLTESTRLYLGTTRLRPDQLPLMHDSGVEIYVSPGTDDVIALQVRPTRTSEVQGRVESIDLEQGQLAFRAPGGVRQLLLAPGSRVLAQGTPVPVSAIAPGDLARVVVISPRSGVVMLQQIQLLNVKVRVANGRLASLDPAAGTMTLTARGGRAASYRVVPNTPILVGWISGLPPEPATLEELAESLSRVEGSEVRVGFIAREGSRLATQVDIRVDEIVEPPPPAR